MKKSNNFLINLRLTYFKKYKHNEYLNISFELILKISS